MSSLHIQPEIYTKDHTSQDLTITKLRKNFTRKVWHYENGNYDNLRLELKNTPWHILLGNCGDDIDEIVEIFTKILTDVTSENIPNYIVKICPHDKQGMTNKVKKLFRNCHKLHKKYKKCKSQLNKELHSEARRLAKSEWARVRYNHFLKINTKMLDNETSSKEWWRIARSQMGLGKAKSIDSLSKGNDLIVDDKMMCDLFNKYFVEEASLCVEDSDEDSLISETYDDPRYSLDTFEIKNNEIIEILSHLNIGKATGIDGINNRILKQCSREIAAPLYIIFNKIITTSTFPSSWKLANVVPVYKKDNPKLVTNYRPISLLSSLSKVFERAIFNKIYNFCELNGILTPHNSGFKKNDSTINRLIHLTHLIHKGLDDEQKVAMVFLDISKAFDKIWHSGLLFKLKKRGIRGNLLKLLESYLRNRSQRVTLNGSFSEFLLIISGVPQGSILGPLLFLIYLNDIVDDISCHISLFADDTSLLEIAQAGSSWLEFKLREIGILV